MYKVIFTLDYEIHGNGEGSPYDLMVEPTERMLNLFEQYGAKLTIFADVAEIIKFKEYYDKFNVDKFNFLKIKKQLQGAIQRDHDVQLHIHSGYFDSNYKNGKWEQNWAEYDLANLPYSTIYNRIKQCKDFLESLLQEVDERYRCTVFRAANWSMSPTPNIYKALIENDIKIDSSVFKHGYRNSNVSFDYSNAFSEIIPWPASSSNICNIDKEGKLWEVPIYTELRNIKAFITPIRLFRMIRAKFHRHEKKSNNSTNKKQRNSSKTKFIKLINKKYPWKMDFNQASGKQLINAMKRIMKKYKKSSYNEIPVVLIGHSKTFIKLNEVTITPFLKYVKNNSDKVLFSKYKDIKLD